MGGKLGRLSCVKANDSNIRQPNKKNKPKRSKSRASKTTIPDQQTNDLIFVDKSTVVAPEASTNQQHDTSVKGIIVEDGQRSQHSEVVLMPTRELQAIQRLEPITECEENSTEPKMDTLTVPINKLTAQLIQDTSKKIGNSIELLHCPDMSTISAFTERSHFNTRRGVAAGAPATKLLTPNITGDEFTAVTPLGVGDVSTMEMTTSTLTVPPNSVNSQFISGITPMDSIQDVEYPDATADSVFERDLSYMPQHCLDQIYYTNYGTGRVYLNNNSMVTSPEYVNVKSDPPQQVSKVGNSVEISDGPGLDSDFGASAGIEMRIVSSDFSGANTTSAMTHRDLANSRDQQKKKSRNDPAGARTLPAIQALPPMNTSDRLSYGLILREPIGNRRPATVGGPEGIFHVTMEWDPYDTDYGMAHWREYFIPGVSYPPQPLLCQEQHWL
ncbi:uncharacterized protein LOC120344487 [Styela clava]|uniref:uncharacterized protein LOC120344487 n=1 Tax=Styela clava TaxID=7725 RepID=UPI00193984BC|nr:uncharacterized protein LOC120344487 [Styela clava]